MYSSLKATSCNFENVLKHTKQYSLEVEEIV